jgi:hypothetical protein
MQNNEPAIVNDVARTPATSTNAIKSTPENTFVPTQSLDNIATQTATPLPPKPTPSATPIPTMTATRTSFGGWLVFSSRRQDTNEDGIIDEQDGVHIYSLNLSTHQMTQLTFGNHRDLHPVWSPDRSQIAFVSNREGNLELYVMNADGSEATRLTNTPEAETQPKWSPDGTKIVYVQARTVEFSLQEKRLYLFSTADDTLRQLTSGPGNDDDPDWSPDGHYIAFDRVESSLGRIVYLLEILTGRIFQLTPSERESGRGEFDNPLWLPRDGYYLSMIQLPGDLSSVGIKVFELQWEDGQPALYRVFAINDAYGWYVWGPNGEWLISIISNGLYYGTVSAEALNDLVVLPVDFSTQRRALTADPTAKSSYSYSLYEGELITNDTFYDNFPDWAP